MTTGVACSMYIDQPVGVGFSYGSETVGTSIAAAEDIWKVINLAITITDGGAYAFLHTVPSNLVCRFTLQQVPRPRLRHLDRIVSLMIYLKELA